MNAVSFAAPIPTYLATLAAGRLSESLLVGPHACTRYGVVATPELPGPDWVRIRTRAGGICGSDLGIVGLATSPSTFWSMQKILVPATDAEFRSM